MQDHWTTCKKTVVGRLLAFSTYDTPMERAGDTPIMEVSPARSHHGGVTSPLHGGEEAVP